MTNPILAMLNGSSFAQIFQSVRNAKDPASAMAQYIQNSPEGQQVMAYIQQNGGNAKDAFYNLARQKGVDPESVLAALR